MKMGTGISGDCLDQGLSPFCTKSPLAPLCQRGEPGAPGQRTWMNVISGAHPGMCPSFLTPHSTKFATDPVFGATVSESRVSYGVVSGDRSLLLGDPEEGRSQ